MKDKLKGIARKLILNLSVAALLVALSADYGAHTIGFVARLENLTFDWRLLGDAEEARRKNDDIVIVDIDNGSLSELGRWPWRRDTMADLTRRLFDHYDVRAAAFTFSFPDANDDAVVAIESVRDGMSTGGGLSPGLRRQLTAGLDNIAAQFDYDGAFADSARGKPVLLAYTFDDGRRIESFLPKAARLHLPDGRAANTGQLVGQFPQMSGYDGNITKLNNAAAGGGHLNVEEDRADGVVRRLPALILHDGGFYESLALALMRLDDIGSGGASKLSREDKLRRDVYGLPTIAKPPLIVEQDDSGNVKRLRANNNYAVDIDADALMFLRFGNTGGRGNFDSDESAAFRYIPAIDIIRAKTPREYLSGKVAIVGSSAGLPRSAYPTGVNPQMPLAEIVAWQVESAWRGDVLFREPSARINELTLFALLALVLAVASVFVGPLAMFILAVAFGGGSAYWALHQWAEFGEVFRLAPVIIIFGGMGIINISSYFIIEWINGRRVKSAFSQYVPPELAERMSGSVEMKSESREISVLFSDIRDFTSIAEKMEPEELAAMMNKMLTAQTHVIHHHGGTVDKFIGDAVMAFWNAPITDKEHAKNAVSSALGMVAGMRELSQEEEKAGRSRLHIGIGICTGTAIVGNMGSEFRVSYTAIGDTVNLSSRTEGLTKHYGVQILATESTRRQCDDEFVWRAVDIVRVKGREEAAMIYEPIGRRDDLSDAVVDALDIFAEMRATYERGDFARALELAQEFNGAMPDDALGAFYQKRIEALVKSPPDKWDGVTAFDSK